MGDGVLAAGGAELALDRLAGGHVQPPGDDLRGVPRPQAQQPLALGVVQARPAGEGRDELLPARDAGGAADARPEEGDQPTGPRELGQAAGLGPDGAGGAAAEQLQGGVVGALLGQHHDVRRPLPGTRPRGRGQPGLEHRDPVAADGALGQGQREQGAFPAMARGPCRPRGGLAQGLRPGVGELGLRDLLGRGWTGEGGVRGELGRVALQHEDVPLAHGSRVPRGLSGRRGTTRGEGCRVPARAPSG